MDALVSLGENKMNIFNSSFRPGMLYMWELWDKYQKISLSRLAFLESGEDDGREF